ncbi:HAD family hydrolase [Bacteroides fragilis]|nr:HAD family hydrolase [Bacteroides fragilis]
MVTLAFLDPPKPSSAEAIRQLREYGIEVKILSGDNDVIVNAIARQIGIDTCHSVTGVELEGKDGEELREIVGQATLFFQADAFAEERDNHDSSAKWQHGRIFG